MTPRSRCMIFSSAVWAHSNQMLIEARSFDSGVPAFSHQSGAPRPAASREQGKVAWVRGCGKGAEHFDLRAEVYEKR